MKTDGDIANPVSSLENHLRKQPAIGRGVFIATGAVVVGNVALGDRSSIWYNAVLRGDIQRITVGAGSNVQDNAVVHLSEELPCRIGSCVTIGHGAIVHACQIGDESLVGMGAVVLDGAVIGPQCVIGAKALVTQGMQIPEGSMVLGMPAKIIRPLSPEERLRLRSWAEHYVHNAAYCLAHRIHIHPDWASACGSRVQPDAH